MATKRQTEDQDRASANRRNDAVGEIIRHYPDAVDDSDARGMVVGVLQALIEAIDGEAHDHTELRRKGWQSVAKANITAAEIVRHWRDLLVAYTPPAGRPAPAEIAVDHRADTPAELDARLEAAFQIPTPVRHVMTVLEPSTLSEANSNDQVKGALCGSGEGSWTHRGGANCVDCIATYDDEHGPYAGPTAFNGGEPDPTEEALSAAAAVDPINGLSSQPDGPAGLLGTLDDPQYKVGDKVTVAGIEFTKHGEWEAAAFGNAQHMSQVADVLDTLNIVDPSPRAPVRQRMTLADVRTVGLGRQRGLEHRSVSQVTGYSDCGTRYALSHMEAPAWWSVGGKALHRCVEMINRAVADGDRLTPGPHPPNYEPIWLQAFDAEIADQHAASPDWPMSTWRGAKKGAEAYDWWRVEGPPMVEKYVAWLRGMLADGWEIARTADPNGVGRPVIELEVTTDVGAAVPNLSIIDMALVHVVRDLLLIVDVKAGSSAPKDTFQLGVYGWALLGVVRPVAPDRVRGAYYRARTGELVPNVAGLPGWPILAMHGWPDVVQRYRDMDAMERQGFYQPNVTAFCGGCGVRDVCPAQSTS